MDARWAQPGVQASQGKPVRGRPTMPSTSWPCRRIWRPLFRPTPRPSSTGRVSSNALTDWFHENVEAGLGDHGKDTSVLGCDPLDLLIA